MTEDERLEEKIARVEALVEREELREDNLRLQSENERLKKGFGKIVGGVGDFFSDLWRDYGHVVIVGSIAIASVGLIGYGGVKGCEFVVTSYDEREQKMIGVINSRINNDRSNIKKTIQAFANNLNQNNPDLLKVYLECRGGWPDSTKDEFSIVEPVSDKVLGSNYQVKKVDFQGSPVCTDNLSRTTEIVSRISQETYPLSYNSNLKFTLGSKGNKDLIFEGNAPIKCWKSKCVFELKKSKFLIVNQEEAIDMAIEYMSNDIKDRLLVKTLEKL